MSESEQPEKKPGHDSRLDAFLREARAVIATEKGMTPTAQTKIKSIADRLNLPAELYEAGQAELQDSGTSLGNLTRYEKAFLAYLEKEFKKIQGGVLSIGMEENAIEKAKQKFNVPPHRADQLIDFQATQSGVGRLARAAANSYGKQMIVDQIGESLAVKTEFEQSFYKLGRQWGLGNDQVRTVLLDTLSQNRRKAKAAQRKRIAKWIGWVCSIAAVSVAVTVGYRWVKSKIDGESLANHSVIDDPAPKPTITDSDALSNKRIASCLQRIAPKLIPQFASERASVRRDAYGELTRTICSNLTLTSANQKQAVDLIGETYFTEPDDAAALRILESIDAFVADRRSQTIRSLKSIYPANRLAALVYGYPDTDGKFVDHGPRKLQLAKMLFKRTGFDLESQSFPAYIQSSEQALAIEQWNWLIQNSWTSPSRSAGLVGSLYELTEDKIEPSTREQFRTRALHTILEADRNCWRDLKQPIESSVKASDEVGVIDWIAIFETGNVSFREFLGPRLATKVGLNPSARFSELEKELKAVRGSYRNRMLGSVLARNKQIDDLMEKFVQREEAQFGSVTPDFIAQAISLGNLSLETCQIINSGRSRDELAFDSLDENLAEHSKRLRDVVFLDDQKRENQSIAATASISDGETKTRVISRLKDLSKSNRALRISGLDQLGRIAKKFQDISYQEAYVLANYLYSDLDREELLEAQQDAPSFSHWTSLVLAGSDVVADSNVQIDQALTISNLLTNVRFEIDTSQQWRESLSGQLFAHASESLAESKVDPNSVGGDWSRLRKFAVRRYRERLSLAGLEFGQSALSPIELLSKLLGSDIDSSSEGFSSGHRFDRAMDLIQHLSDNEIAQIVMVNGLLIEKNVNRLRSMSLESTREVETIFSRFEMQMSRDSNLGAKLLYTESCLARLWSLERRVATQQLMERF